jgi:hypothetical protein
MNEHDFVAQCRQEWSRLGVPDPLADEMATDLASDLGEAEAEGVPAEELLGSSFFDPRSFAAAWAAERGVIPTRPERRRSRRRPLVLVAFTALAAIILIVAALLLLTGEPQVSVVAVRAPGAHFPVPPRAAFIHPAPDRQVMQSANASAPVEWILLFLAVVALGFAAWLWSSWSRSRPPTAAA